MDEQKTPEIDEKTKQIGELNEILINLAFFSDQVRFNQTIHKALGLILTKLESIEIALKELKNVNQ